MAVKYFGKLCQLLEGMYFIMSAKFQRIKIRFEYTIQEFVSLETFLSIIFIPDLIGQSYILHRLSL